MKTTQLSFILTSKNDPIFMRIGIIYRITRMIRRIFSCCKLLAAVCCGIAVLGLYTRKRVGNPRISLLTADLNPKVGGLVNFECAHCKKGNPRISLLTADLNPKVKVGVLVFAVGFSIRAELAQ